MEIDHPSNEASLLDVLDRCLDKGVVIDAWARVSLAGIDLMTFEARVIVASIETYLHESGAVATTRLAARPDGDGQRRALPVAEAPESLPLSRGAATPVPVAANPPPIETVTPQSPVSAPASRSRARSPR